jgi:hypothetical protein
MASAVNEIQGKDQTQQAKGGIVRGRLGTSHQYGQRVDDQTCDQQENQDRAQARWAIGLPAFDGFLPVLKKSPDGFSAHWVALRA